VFITYNFYETKLYPPAIFLKWIYATAKSAVAGNNYQPSKVPDANSYFLKSAEFQSDKMLLMAFYAKFYA